MKTCENGFEPSIAQAIEEMKAEQGKNFSLERINLAELERRTGVSRARLRRLKANNFHVKPHASTGKRPKATVLSGYSAVLDALLTQGITNSSVLLQRLQTEGYTGSLTTVKRYIQSHRSLIPAKRQPRKQIHYGARRSLPDGLGLYKGGRLHRERISGSLLRHDLPPLRTAVY